MPAIGAIGAIGGFAAPAIAAGASRGPSAGPAAAFAAGPAEGPLPSGVLARGLDGLEALAILELLTAHPRQHGAEALNAMLIALALNAYTSVQAIAPPSGALPASTAPGAGLHLRA